jgi:hypothetical protein
MAASKSNDVRYALLIVGLAVFLIVAFVLGINVLWHLNDHRIRQRMQQQIAAVKSGKAKSIWASNEIDSAGRELDELVKAKGNFRAEDDFELDVMYSQEVDAFLGRLSGIQGVTTLYFHNSDVTDAGMVHVATFPHLKTLILERGGITDRGIEALDACPRLEELVFTPTEKSTVSIAALLSLPRVQRLTVYAPDGSSWLRDRLSQFGKGTKLKELTLIDNDLPVEEIEKLRSQLPDCKFKAIPPGKET